MNDGMHSSLYFSLPLPSRKQPKTLRVSRNRARKRKRREDEVPERAEDGRLEDDRQAVVPDHDPSHPSTTVAGARPRLTAGGDISEDAEQYRVAGYTAAGERLPDCFPHRSLDVTREDKKARMRNVDTGVQRALSELSPPLFLPQKLTAGGKATVTSTPTTDLRRHHMSVLTTIMQRCLLDGDYDRAGRAWAMILRTDVRGKAPDLRGEGRWGIGPEILLRQDHQSEREELSQDPDEASTVDLDDGPEDLDAPRSMGDAAALYTKEGFSKAKEYYERLILEYPYHRRWTSTVNSLDFYPAMFGLWIYATHQERAKRWEAAVGDQDETLRSEPEQPGRDMAEEMRGRELLGAELIASRMDEVLLSPPHSDSPELWHLRGMVALWMADLCLPAISTHAASNRDENSKSSVDNSPQGRLRPSDAGHHEDELARRNDELDRARSAFQKVRLMGGSVWEGVNELPHDS